MFFLISFFVVGLLSACRSENLKDFDNDGELIYADERYSTEQLEWNKEYEVLDVRESYSKRDEWTYNKVSILLQDEQYHRFYIYYIYITMWYNNMDVINDETYLSLVMLSQGDVVIRGNNDYELKIINNN